MTKNSENKPSAKDNHIKEAEDLFARMSPEMLEMFRDLMKSMLKK